ncbi:hypothetical protein [uncultured Nitrosomonas sp.]|uniref:hypothetical protein n=1 Tax=uncultured Nitrosomonas sp. TaxID=156424 RepID=UPI0025E070C9|nr:hypothetical protein [uncultured Nitrosomonas sp.]
MPHLLNPESLLFFFGPHFDVDVALTTAKNLPNLEGLCEGIKRSIDEGVPHIGLHLVGYENIDTGLSALAAVSKPNAPSMISFYAESSHRIFGGATLVCVPLAFCSSHFVPSGEYVVYRHTYKRPLVTETEYSTTMQSGSDEERMRLFLFTRSREGFETITGMSYVGISKRPWQQRLAEHIDSAMAKQSKTKLHEAIRQMQGQKVIHVHDVSAYGISEAEARQYESKLIASSTLWPLGLNMKC